MILRLGRCMALLNHALAPVVARERAVHRKAEGIYARQGREAILNLAVKTSQSFAGISRAGRIEVENVPVACSHSKVLVLKVVESARHQDRSGQQHD